MSRYACMIDSRTPDSFPLECGSTAGFMSLDLPKFVSFRPEGKAHSDPVALEDVDGKHPHVGPYILNREIVDIVEVQYGPCKWAYSLGEYEAFDRVGNAASSPIIWAWSADGKLRCIAASGRWEEVSS